MKNIFLVTSAFLLLFTLSVSGQAPEKPHVVILTTGGTIASRSDAPSLEGHALVQAVPQILDYATVNVEEITRTGSSRITPEIWLRLGKRINEIFSQDGTINGIVVTHGTDTMEETAYYLNLVVKDDRPVVMVGSMRSADVISADGPSNLLQAVRVATKEHSKNRGVMIVLNDEINSARDAWKTDNQRVQTFRSIDHGILGYADPDTIIFYRNPSHLHTVNSIFQLDTIEALPEVPIVIDYAGFDGSTIIQWANRHPAGIVVQTFAGGRMSSGALEGIQRATEEGIPIVIASRVPGGRIPGSPSVAGTILARDLPAHKARVLLMVALAETSHKENLTSIFNQY
ncbi:MAG TPA: asparaginase [Gemmatimonadetes bacterium]|jgi:L-asparaginase|nr:asparaginase [Gemmatimonadota bacterium]